MPALTTEEEALKVRLEYILSGGTGGSIGEREPMTDGDPVTPELIFDDDGDVVMGEV